MPRPRAPLLALLALAACGPQDGREGGALGELERLAFVPPGECRLVGRGGLVVTCANPAALLVDRWEVPRREWAAWAAAADLPPDPERDSLAAPWPEEQGDWPASGMTLDEARAFAAARGKRLPTAAEWVRIAAGTRAQPWPWGSTRASSVANTAELGLGRPVPVGTFEQGCSPESVYDLVGNVAEWVDAPLESGPDRDFDVLPLAWAMGGSYATRLWKVHDVDGRGAPVVLHLDLDPRARATDVGLRCVAEAGPWLVAHAGAVGDGTEVRARLVAIGRRWGREAIPLLEELAARPAAAPAIASLLEGARR